MSPLTYYLFSLEKDSQVGLFYFKAWKNFLAQGPAMEISQKLLTWNRLCTFTQKTEIDLPSRILTYLQP